jgi:DNA-directed RNA polymerase subunit RPC12/RpoP
MAVCAACGSSRVRNDYKPAPWWLRIIGIRALLCDYCNYQFRAFSPLPPKTRRPRQATQKADVFNAAPVVNLRHLDRNNSGDRQELSSEPAPVINFNRAPSVSDEVTPVRTDLRTQITRLHGQSAKAKPEPVAEASTSATSVLACPDCGSQNLKRRPRNTVEKAVLSFTTHKPYNCRDCGAAFYAKDELENATPQPRSAQHNLLESQAFSRERGWPKGER